MERRRGSTSIGGSFNARGDGASGSFLARGLSDANARWVSIGAFIVLTGFGFNQWVNGIVRIIEAFRTL